jgi:hypothetical protein
MRPVSARLLIVALAFALVGLGAGCGGDDAGEAFEEKVVDARNTADSSFAFIKRPKSTEDLVDRLRASGKRIAGASGSIAAADVPEELADEQRRLARALGEMSKEMTAAANSIQLVIDGQAPGVGPVETLVFDTWDSVQAVLNDLRAEGIDVPPLRPGGGP